MEKEKTKKLYGPFSRLVANSVQSSVRKVALKFKFRNIHRKTPVLESLFNRTGCIKK